MTNEMKRQLIKEKTGEIIAVTGGYVQDWLQFETDSIGDY
jgi:hypothetical protein